MPSRSWIDVRPNARTQQISMPFLFGSNDEAKHWIVTNVLCQLLCSKLHIYEKCVLKSELNDRRYWQVTRQRNDEKIKHVQMKRVGISKHLVCWLTKCGPRCSRKHSRHSWIYDSTNTVRTTVTLNKIEGNTQSLPRCLIKLNFYYILIATSFLFYSWLIVHACVCAPLCRLIWLASKLRINGRTKSLWIFRLYLILRQEWNSNSPTTSTIRERDE